MDIKGMTSVLIHNFIGSSSDQVETIRAQYFVAINIAKYLNFLVQLQPSIPGNSNIVRG